MDHTLTSELYNNIKFNMQKLILDVPEEDAGWLSRIFNAEEESVRKLLAAFESTVSLQAEEIRKSGNIPKKPEIQTPISAVGWSKASP